MPAIYPANQGDVDSGDSTAASKDDQKLLDRIRKRFDYMVKAWKDIWAEAELDQQALSPSGPWKKEDRDAREGVRPCLHLDQLTQYINALINEVRSNPIALKIDPAGEGSDKNTAELRANRIREIEYASNAMQAYQTAFEGAVSHSFGVFGITIEYKSWDSAQREIKVRRFANPYSVLADPDTKEADRSDMQDAFVLDRVLKSDFERLYPKATITSFGADVTSLAPLWFDDDSIQRAEYWYTVKTPRRLFLVELSPGKQHKFFADELESYRIRQKTLILKDGTALPLLHDRETEEPKIHKCLTNGVEILDQTDWPGKWIPIIPVIGKEKYERHDNKIKRVIDSYIRMARDGQMLFDYYKTNEAEVVGQSSKNLRIGYEGQFETATDWTNINKIPTAFAEVKAHTEEVPSEVLPIPRFDSYEPPIQALEIGAESARRSIQAAVASYGYTRLDDTNVKSGVALKQVQQQNDMGNFHFIDNYKIALRHGGRIINDLLDDVESEPMDVGTRTLDDKHEVVRINEEMKDGKINQYRLTDEAQHEVTISTGPNFQSQREAGVKMGESLVANMANLPLEPVQKQKLLAKIIKQQQLGPIGDQMEEIISPEPEEGQGIPPQVQQAMAQMQQQLQLAQAALEQLQAENVQLQQKLDAKILDIDSRENIEALKAEIELAKLASTESLEAMKREMELINQAIEDLRQPIEQPTQNQQ
jgi:hypothetical protein